MQYIDLIKIGEVSSIDANACTVRVVFDDEDGVVSYDYPVIQRNTLHNHDWAMPDVGEDVIVLLFSEGLEDGVVIGSLYAGKVIPPESTIDKRTVVFADGTRASYDRKTHVLTITIEGTEIIFDRQQGSITVPKTMTVNCEGSIVNCKTAEINASEHVSINSPATDVSGTLTVQGLITGAGGFAISGGSGATCAVTGTVEVSGDVTAGGISLMHHVHKEQGDGADTSAPK